MDWKSVGSAITKIVPMLGTVIAGPAAGGAISIVTSALGLDGDAQPDDVAKAIETDPDATLKLKQAEMDNQVELGKLALQNDSMYLQDRQSARQRQIESEKATGKRDGNLYVLAWTVVTGFFALCIVLMFVNLPEGSSQVVFMLFGSLSTGFGTVLSYFFGSSKSSSDKTKMLTASNPQN